MFYIICTALKWYIFAHAIDVEIVYLEGRQRKSVLGKDIWSLRDCLACPWISLFCTVISHNSHILCCYSLLRRFRWVRGATPCSKPGAFFKRGAFESTTACMCCFLVIFFWIMDKGIAKAFHMVWQNLKEMGKVFMEWWIKMQKIGSKTTTIYCVATKIMLGA